MTRFVDDLKPDVSRETLGRLKELEKAVHKWTPKINLVAPSTLSNVWERHIIDSVQIYHLQTKPWSHWLDLGSGAGFPGMVVAILSLEKSPDARVTLIESDARKSAFLRYVKTRVGVSATILNQRIEMVEPQNADVVSARALASLDHLLVHASRHLQPNGTALFHKGVRWEEEVQDAKSKWNFFLTSHKSITEPDAAILELGEISHV